MTFYPADMRWFQQSSPRYGETYIMQAYNDEGWSAQKRAIVISNAYFVPRRRNTRPKDSYRVSRTRPLSGCVDVTHPARCRSKAMAPSSKSAGRSFYKDLLESNTEARTILWLFLVFFVSAGRDKTPNIEWQASGHGEIYQSRQNLPSLDRKVR